MFLISGKNGSNLGVFTYKTRSKEPKARNGYKISGQKNLPKIKIHQQKILQKYSSKNLSKNSSKKFVKKIR